MTITLTTDQEKFIQQQLETGKYSNPTEVITEALALLASQQNPKKYVIQRGELAQKKLQEKIAMAKKLMAESNNKPVDPQRAKLAEEFKELCAETQVLHANNTLTDEEIEAEIEAYRRGE